MDTCNKREEQNSNESTSPKEAGYSQQYINDCQKFNKLIERNIRTLRRISYKDKLEELYQGFENEDQLRHLDFYNFSFSQYIGLAKLLTFWDEYIPNNVICSHSKPLQKQNSITGFMDFSTLKPKSGLKKSTKRISIFKINNMTILQDFLEKQIGEICCNVVFNLHQILQAIDEKNLSMLPESPIIPKETIETLCQDCENITTESRLPMEYFYKDFLSVYYWDGLFGEISGKIGDLLYDILSQCYKLNNPDHAHFTIRMSILDSLNLLTLSEKSIKERIWLKKNSYCYYNEISYVICYTVCTYRNSNDTNKLIPILLDGITSDTLQHFNPLWNKLKRYVEYKDRLRVNVESLNKNTVFQHIKTLDEAIDYLRYVEGNEPYNSIGESSKDTIVPDKENNDKGLTPQIKHEPTEPIINETSALLSHGKDRPQVNKKADDIKKTIIPNLYEKMNKTFFEGTSPDLLYYILTDKDKPNDFQPITWKASSRSFAVFIGIVYNNRNNKWILAKERFNGKFNKNLSDDYSKFIKKYNTNSISIPDNYESTDAYLSEKDEELKKLMGILYSYCKERNK